MKIVIALRVHEYYSNNQNIAIKWLGIGKGVRWRITHFPLPETICLYSRSLAVTPEDQRNCKT